MLILCRTIRSYLSLVTLAVSMTLVLAGSSGAQVAARIPDIAFNVNGVSEIDGEIWLATDKGAYRIHGNVVQIISQPDLGILKVRQGTKSQGGTAPVWLATNAGAYLMDGAGLRRVTDSELVVNDIVEIKDHIWLATDKGAYRVDGNIPHLITPADVDVTAIVEIKKQIWILTNEGAYRVNGNGAERVPIQIWEGKGETLLAANSIEGFEGQVWLGMNRGAYRLVGSTPLKIRGVDVEVHLIKRLNGQVWLATEKGAYRIAGEVAQLISDPRLNVTGIDEIRGEVWLSTDRGAYRFDGKNFQLVSDPDLVVSTIKEVDRELWLVTDQGAYRFQENVLRRIPDAVLQINAIEEFNGEVWLATEAGAYRLDKSLSVSVNLRSADTWWVSILQSILPPGVWIGGLVRPDVRYDRATGNISDAEQPKQRFELIWETNEIDFYEALKEERYNAAERSLLPLTSGQRTIYYSVRDKWGNTFGSRLPIRVIPGPAALLVPAIVFWTGLLMLTLVLAPVSTFCHSLLMNPFLRKYGSFGLLPLLLTVIPPVRRHVIRRYVRSLRRDERIVEWQQRFVLPTDDFLPENFGRLLGQRRTLLLVGQSGIGKTSYLRYLTGCYASRQSRRLAPGKSVPVLLQLSRYEGATIEEMLQAELSNFGKLSDKELNAWFLQQGGFVIFVDGLNEAREATRQSVSRFVNQHWKANYFCISSQQSYVEFEWMEKIDLAPLSSDKVREMIEKRLDAQRAKAMLDQFGESTYEAYRIPQDLEFAIDLVKQNQPLPRSKRDIYSATLQPVLESWEEAGHSDYSALLCRRAYEMLSAGEVSLDRDDDPLPDEIRERLAASRFIIRRGERFQFRHDLVKAYLAARYFAPRWQHLLAEDEVLIDSNWTAMLQFGAVEINNSREIKELLVAVLDKSILVAGDVFKWLARTHQLLCLDWSDEFKLKYGEAILRPDSPSRRHGQK